MCKGLLIWEQHQNDDNEIKSRLNSDNVCFSSTWNLVVCHLSRYLKHKNVCTEL